MHDDTVALKWSDDARAPTVMWVAVDILFDFTPWCVLSKVRSEESCCFRGLVSVRLQWHCCPLVISAISHGWQVIYLGGNTRPILSTNPTLLLPEGSVYPALLELDPLTPYTKTERHLTTSSISSQCSQLVRQPKTWENNVGLNQVSCWDSTVFF